MLPSRLLHVSHKRILQLADCICFEFSISTLIPLENAWELLLGFVVLSNRHHHITGHRALLHHLPRFSHNSGISGGEVLLLLHGIENIKITR